MSFQVFQAQGLRIYAGDTATVNSYTGLPNELAINTETKSVRVLDGVTPGGVPLTTTSGAELQGLNIEQLANLLVTTPQNGEALVYQDGKWTNQPVAASGGASHVNDLVDVKLTNLQTGEVLSYNASISKWENKAVAAADHNHDTKYQAKGNYLTTTSNLGEINNVQITMPADGQSLVYDEGYQKWINTTLAGVAGGSSGTIVSETSPVGMIAPFAMETAPDEWLVCDGSTLNSVANPEYADLFDAIGTTWGGTGASDFKLPDLQGTFLRGSGSQVFDGKTFDGGNVSELSKDTLQAHEHKIGAITQAGSTYDNAVAGASASGNWTTDAQTRSAGDHETKPFSATVLYCIKYKAAAGSAAEPAYFDGGYRFKTGQGTFTAFGTGNGVQWPFDMEMRSKGISMDMSTNTWKHDSTGKYVLTVNYRHAGGDLWTCLAVTKNGDAEAVGVGGRTGSGSTGMIESRTLMYEVDDTTATYQLQGWVHYGSATIGIGNNTNSDVADGTPAMPSWTYSGMTENPFGGANGGLMFNCVIHKVA